MRDLADPGLEHTIPVPDVAMRGSATNMPDLLVAHPFAAMRDALVKLSRTRANYWLEFVLDTALGAAFLAEGIRRHASLPGVVAFVLLGLLVFSFMEYVFHRWLFHGRVPLLAGGHAAHHANPQGYDAWPFFLPALVLFCVAGAFALVIPLAYAELLASGIAFGYVAYGLGHFVIHRMRFRRPLVRRWAARHHIHHHHPDCNFGVTSALWDALFGTRYVPARSGPSARARGAPDGSAR